MRHRSRWVGLLAVPLLLTGCAGAQAADDPADDLADDPAASSTSAAGAPPEAAAMVCAGDVPEDITRALALDAPPPATSTWVPPLFTCNYDLPAGPLVLAVHESPTPAEAAAYLDQQSAALPGAAPTVGLGERAAADPAGTVVVLKDDMVLTIDATALPAVFGDNGQRRDAFAFEVASIVMGCWTRHE